METKEKFDEYSIFDDMFDDVYEANSIASGEVPEFVPTRDELIQLVKYWATMVIDIRYWSFVAGQTGRDDFRLENLALVRIQRIAEIIGDEEVAKAVNEAKAELSKEAQGWDIFLNGTEEQREAFRVEFQQGMRANEKEQKEI